MEKTRGKCGRVCAECGLCAVKKELKEQTERLIDKINRQENGH